MGVTDPEVPPYTVTRQPERTMPRAIDYARMNAEWPKQKRALTRALGTKDPVRVAQVCIDSVKVWDEVGAWPDSWAMFQRALDDVLPWNQHVDLADIAYGRVKIERRADG